MNKEEYKTFEDLKEELGKDYAYKLYEMGISALKEIDRLKDLCNKYEEEHNTAFKLWTQKMEEMPDYEEKMELKKEVVRLNNIINRLDINKIVLDDLLIKLEYEYKPTKKLAVEDIQFFIKTRLAQLQEMSKLKELKEGNKDDNR